MGNMDSSISQSSTYNQTINLSDSTNPTSSKWIASANTSGPHNWMTSSLYSVTGNDWGKYFENTNICGYAVDSSNALIKSTSQITNPNANLVTTLSTQSLNISDSLPSSSSPSSSSSSSSNSNPTSSSSSSSSSTSTDAAEIKALESKINDEINALPTETQAIAKSALSAIESSGTSATTLQDLTKLASLLSNKNLSPTQLGQDLDSLLA